MCSTLSFAGDLFEFFALLGPDGLKIIHHLLLVAESEMEVVEVFTVLLAVVTSLKIQMRWRLLT